jgi:protein-disulfide isomerase
MAKGQKGFFLAIGAVVVAAAVFFFYALNRGPAIAIPANVVVTPQDTSGFHGYVLGSPDAPIEIVEYADFECIVCANWEQVQFPYVKTSLIDPGKVRWRVRDYPLDGTHRHPRIASHAVACANDQGKVWEVSDAMFHTQNEWSLVADPMPGLTGIVKAAGLDVNAWTECMKSGKYAGRIQASVDEGNRLGVGSTPTFLINGNLYDAALTSDKMIALVDSLIAAKTGGATHP